MPPFLHESAVEVQLGFAGTSHWVDQTATASGAGGVRLMLLTVMLTR